MDGTAAGHSHRSHRTWLFSSYKTIHTLRHSCYFYLRNHIPSSTTISDSYCPEHYPHKGPLKLQKQLVINMLIQLRYKRQAIHVQDCKNPIGWATKTPAGYNTKSCSPVLMINNFRTHCNQTKASIFHAMDTQRRKYCLALCREVLIVVKNRSFHCVYPVGQLTVDLFTLMLRNSNCNYEPEFIPYLLCIGSYNISRVIQPLNVFHEMSKTLVVYLAIIAFITGLQK